MSESQSPAKEELNSALHSIERIIKPKFFFLFGAFIFALDCGINYLSHQNLYSIGSDLTISSFDWGKFSVFLMIFSFLMAFLMKIIKYTIEEFIRIPIISLHFWWKYSAQQYNKHHSDSEFYPTEAMKIALDRGDTLLYEIAKAKADLYKSQIQENLENAQMAFSTLGFMLLNQFFFGDAQSYPTLLQQFTTWAESENEGDYIILVFTVWATVVFSWLWNSFLVDIHPEKIYVPKVDETKKIRSEVRPIE
jgi:hypothetical protein